MKRKRNWIVFVVKLGVSGMALNFAFGSIAELEQGRHGNGLVDAGLCVLYLLVATLDLEQLWGSRHSSVMFLIRTDRHSAKFYLAATLFYTLIVSGAILQIFFE